MCEILLKYLNDASVCCVTQALVMDPEESIYSDNCGQRWPVRKNSL